MLRIIPILLSWWIFFIFRPILFWTWILITVIALFPEIIFNPAVLIPCTIAIYCGRIIVSKRISIRIR